MNERPHVYTKSRLIKELAFRAGIKKIASRQILEVLAEIIKRETPNGPFILPGLCKFEVVPRKARRIRNPRTGEALILPPQKALKITAARSAKLAIAPRIPAVPAALYVPPAEETPPPVVAPAPEPVPPPAPEPTPAPVEEPAPAPAEPAPAPVPAEESAPAPAEPAPVSAPAEEPAPAPAEPAPVPASAEEPAPAPAEPAPAPAPAEEPAPAPTEQTSASAEPPPVPAESASAPAEEPMPAPTEESAPAEEPQPEAISFKCPGCGQEIEAPLDAVGLDAECPMCGRIVVVPAKSEPGTMYGPSVGDAPKSTEPVVSAKEAEEMDPAQLKNRTIRIDAEELGLVDPAPAKKEPVEEKLISFFCPNCHQEIEATADMAGTPAECPNCGLTFEVPFFSEAGSIHDEHRQENEAKASAQAQKGKTMRIDLPDDF